MKQNLSLTAYIRHVIVFFISAMILGLGTACFVKADLGADAMSTFALGIQHHTPIRVDIAIFIIMYAMMAGTFLIDKTRLGIVSFLYPLISSSTMNIGLNILPESDQIIACYIMLSTGIALMAIAIAVGSKTNVGYNPYDSLAFAILERYKLTYTKVRRMIDGSFLIIGILLGGTFATGTILVLILLGPCSDFFMKSMDKPLQNILKIKEKQTI